LTPPDVRTARVLEVGVGDGLNTLSIAQSMPGAEVIGFDLEADGIARGEARRVRVGLSNATLAAADLTDLAAIPGPFDYIIAHGVFAWVPEPIADALLAMIGARLARHGVAYVSADMLPGGYGRLALRDAMLHATAGANDEAQRREHARRMLAEMAEERPDDTGPRKGFRALARERLDDGAGSLFHHELGEAYRPWYLSEMLARAQAHGLTLLGDASDQLVAETFGGGGTPAARQAAYEQRAVHGDLVNFRFFRRALLVRSGIPIPRTPDPRVIETLYAYSLAEEVAPGAFRHAPHSIRVDHPPLAGALRRLIGAAPERVPVSALGLPDPLLMALVGLFDFGIVQLATTPGAHVSHLSDRPRASPLARDLAAERGGWCATLGHRGTDLNPGAAAALALLDGTVDRATVLDRLAAAGVDGPAALDRLRREALLLG
jgi:hypothetical protein